MASILLLGSSGQLGIELQKALPEGTDLLALSRRDVDLSNEDALRSVIRKTRPRFIVNAAAYTAVDRAESEAELARAVNAVAPTIIAEEARLLGAWLLHFSTDYVFNGAGNTPWKESDAPHPLNVYGRTKLEGEQGVASAGCRHLIFRTSWVYASHGRNFLLTMLRLARERERLTIIDDQTGAPTSAKELARATVAILNRVREEPSLPPEPGIYHMTCSGSTTWFGFAREIFSILGARVRAPELVPISTEEYPTRATRPRNSILNCDKLEHATGIRLPSWQSALAEVTKELKGQLP
jgi:dTDP-4-dehydrorhamnose reductase